jgi:nucleotide-binding universal stress UspA family protein
MTCILAAIDLGPATEAVIATACDLARAFSLPVHLVSAFSQARPEQAEHAAHREHPEFAKAAKHLRARLDDLRLRLQGEGLTCQVHSAGGQAAEVISQYAERIQARYIVLGAREPSALRHLVAKSVPAEVMRLAQVPVVFAGDWQRREHPLPA